MEKYEGLWLGGWVHRSDCPVQWTSEKIKVLGVFLGNGNLDKCNWRPRLDAVTRCLNSWRSRHLSFTGRALVANALALSRVWYVASLLPMPVWVLSELNTVLFSFFWGGKKDLVARAVVVHPKPAGGFSVVSVRHKVYALLVQWVRRMVVSPSGWVSLLTFWFFDRFGTAPHDVFSNPASFAPERLPPFYASLLRAWGAIQGSSSSSSSSLVVGSPQHVDPVAVASVSTKSCYVLLLSLSPCIPHCVSKFSPIYGPIDWKSTWASLYFLPLDRPVSDLNWKIAHGVLYTADRLISFGLDIPAACFCGTVLETTAHLFFCCPLARSGLDWIQTLLSTFSVDAPSLDVRHLLFGFSEADLRIVPKVFLICLMCVSSSSGLKGMTFVFAPSGQALSALFAPSRLGCVSFFPFSFVVFVLLGVVGFFISNGVLMGLLVVYVMVFLKWPFSFVSLLFIALSMMLL